MAHILMLVTRPRHDPSSNEERAVHQNVWDGGEGGIRTHGPVAGTHAFQACRFVHSRTSPHREVQRGVILARTLCGSKANHYRLDPTALFMNASVALANLLLR